MRRKLWHRGVYDALEMWAVFHGGRRAVICIPVSLPRSLGIFVQWRLNLGKLALIPLPINLMNITLGQRTLTNHVETSGLLFAYLLISVCLLFIYSSQILPLFFTHTRPLTHKSRATSMTVDGEFKCIPFMLKFDEIDRTSLLFSIWWSALCLVNILASYS